MALCDAILEHLYFSPDAFLPLNLVLDAYHVGCAMYRHVPNRIKQLQGRPPPRFLPDPRLDEWRTTRDAHTVPTVDGLGQVNYRTMMEATIRDFGRDDWENYKPLLVQFLRLFGAGIHESLTRTCPDQLSNLSGTYSDAEATDWIRLR